MSERAFAASNLTAMKIIDIRGILNMEPVRAEPMSGTGQRITFTAISMKRKSCSEMGTL